MNGRIVLLLRIVLVQRGWHTLV